MDLTRPATGDRVSASRACSSEMEADSQRRRRRRRRRDGDGVAEARQDGWALWGLVRVRHCLYG